MDNIVWIDKNYNEYKMNEISDRYLLNIINFMGRGGGRTDFLTPKRIEDLFFEARKRDLSHNISMIETIEKLRDKEESLELMNMFIDLEGELWSSDMCD